MIREGPLSNRSPGGSKQSGLIAWIQRLLCLPIIKQLQPNSTGIHIMGINT